MLDFSALDRRAFLSDSDLSLLDGFSLKNRTSEDTQNSR